MHDVVVRVDPSLAFLLPLRDRAARERRLGFDPDATVGHVVRAAGVPLTEVGALARDGVPVDAAARTAPGVVLDVLPDARRPPRRPPPGAPAPPPGRRLPARRRAGPAGPPVAAARPRRGMGERRG